MKDKIKLYGPIVISALLFYMMIETPHSRALGDIVLESLGLKAWTAGNMGLHLTVVYFALLLLVVILASRLITVNYNISKFRRFFIFAGTVCLIYLIHSSAIHERMRQNEGLRSMAITPSGGSYEYRIKEKEGQEFICEVELANYSDEARQFTIVGINNNVTDIILHERQGTPVQFNIAGKETRSYTINHNDYTINLKDVDTSQSIAGTGTIDTLLLQDNHGNKVKVYKLNHRNFN